MGKQSVDDKSQFRKDKIQQDLQQHIVNTVNDTLLTNRIPVAIADKLSRQIMDNLDISEFYQLVEQEVHTLHYPKQRVLDRSLVYMFETLFRAINEQGEYQEKEFFNLVPRGECLELFLQLVKEYCMGDAEIQLQTDRITPLLNNYRHGLQINWSEVYQSEDFKSYLKELLGLILTHLRDDPKPIPALENRIPVRYQPYPISSFLNQVNQLSQQDISVFTKE